MHVHEILSIWEIFFPISSLRIFEKMNPFEQGLEPGLEEDRLEDSSSPVSDTLTPTVLRKKLNLFFGFESYYYFFAFYLTPNFISFYFIFISNFTHINLKAQIKISYI